MHTIIPSILVSTQRFVVIVYTERADEFLHCSDAKRRASWPCGRLICISMQQTHALTHTDRSPELVVLGSNSVQLLYHKSEKRYAYVYILSS
jgi:hypothetical protein